MHTIEKCYLLVRKNGIVGIENHPLSEFRLSLEEIYNVISPVLRIEFSIINELNELIEVACVKLIVNNSDRIEDAFELQPRLTLKEVESILIPF